MNKIKENSDEDKVKKSRQLKDGEKNSKIAIEWQAVIVRSTVTTMIEGLPKEPTEKTIGQRHKPNCQVVYGQVHKSKSKRDSRQESEVDSTKHNCPTLHDPPVMFVAGFIVTVDQVNDNSIRREV